MNNNPITPESIANYLIDKVGVLAKEISLMPKKEKIMELFRNNNTDGYTQDQLDALNAEWEKRANELELIEGTADYTQASKSFCDEVARR